MAKVYAYRCEVCGKEERDPKGWRSLRAECSGTHDVGGMAGVGQAFGLRSGRQTIAVSETGGRNLTQQGLDGPDLCSPECAGKWVFR